MKIKVCKSYLDNIIYDYDKYRYLNGDGYYSTFLSDYNIKFIEEDVNQEQLIDYINKGYAIKINC